MYVDYETLKELANININIVECKLKDYSYFLQCRKNININIVECKSH